MLGRLQPQGTEWRVWDLHIHTPASLVHHYGGDDDKIWERFLVELESLPSDTRVIGINDYWFLDGYRRVRQAKMAGRLSNIDAVFPVVEMRLSQFGGTDGSLSRVNLHVIFDPEVDPDVIEQQFLNRLSGSFALKPESRNASWSGAITRASLADLGREIKASVPAPRLGEYGSDLSEGFNNLNISFDKVQEVLESTYLAKRYLLGVGKTEWAAIRWNDQSIAAKKDVIDRAHLLFTAYQDVNRWESDVSNLRAARVNHKIIDCSDSHHWSDSRENERLGSCLTWINATPTFAGLFHALDEYEHRVFVGLEPPILARVRSHPERFVQTLRVSSTDTARFTAFNYELPLNSGFVAIVGNKGQGKSALLDCLALAGNSSRRNEFAFLNPQRFLSPANKDARQYYAELVWANGASRRAEFQDSHDRAAPISVEYLPQAFVERVCTADPLSGEGDEFENELREVLFTHIGEEERAGEASFDALLKRRTSAASKDTQRRRAELGSLVQAYCEVARFRSAHSVSDVDIRIKLKEGEIERAESGLAEAQAALETLDDSSQADAELERLRSDSERITNDVSQLRSEDQGLQRGDADDERNRLALTEIESRLADIQSEVRELNLRANQILGGMGASAEPLARVEIELSAVVAWRAASDGGRLMRSERREQIRQLIDSLTLEQQRVSSELVTADSARELSRQRVLQLRERLASLQGTAEDEGSLEGLKTFRERVRSAPKRLKEARESLLSHAELIHSSLRAQLAAVEGMYRPAADFIAESAVVQNAGLAFKAELRVGSHWRTFANSLDGRKSPDLGEWLAAVPSRIEASDWQSISVELDEFLVRLETERGAEEGAYRDPATTLRSGMTLVELLDSVFDLSWIEVRFGLTGEGLPLSQLSPGQRGLVLALFYLVVDRRTTPLLLDQPEENLDNATIASLLVPAIREAAGRRQTLVVTHNANLAVVGDADQIVHCQALDRTFTVTSGSISELDVARFAIDVLEGTKPAFDSRRSKYEAFPELS